MDRERCETDGQWALAIFGSLTLVYWFGRSLSFGGGDSPEHMVSCLSWGVSHPPGYPLYTFLGHFFSKLPLGSPEGNVSGFSGLCSAAAVAVFFLLMRRFGLSVPSALTSAGLAAFSPLFWYYSEVAEVRALNNLLAILAAYFAVRLGETKKRLDLVALTAVLGLGISHHPTYVLILPAIGFWLWREKALPRGQGAVASAAVVLVFCALPYLVMGLRVHASPSAYNPWEVRSWEGVMRHFLRDEAGGLWRAMTGNGLYGPGGFSFEKLMLHGRWLAGSLLFEPGFAGFLLAVLGAAWLAARRRAVLWFWGLWAGVGLGVSFFLVSQQLQSCFLGYTHAIAIRFYLMPFLGLFALAGFGTHYLSEWLKPSWRWVLPAVAVLPWALNPVSARGRDSQLNYATEILADSEPGDMILVGSDGTHFALDYLDYAQHRTQGRVFLNVATFSAPWYVQSLQRRYPDLDLPLVRRGGLSTDWREWMRRNPSRKLYAEILFLQHLRPTFSGVSPRGVLAAALVKPPSQRAVAAEIRKFMASSATGRLSMADIPFRTPDIYMARVARDLLLWHESLLDVDKDAALRAEIRQRLAAL